MFQLREEHITGMERSLSAKPAARAQMRLGEWFPWIAAMPAAEFENLYWLGAKAATELQLTTERGHYAYVFLTLLMGRQAFEMPHLEWTGPFFFSFERTETERIAYLCAALQEPREIPGLRHG